MRCLVKISMIVLVLTGWGLAPLSSVQGKELTKVLPTKLAAELKGAVLRSPLSRHALTWGLAALLAMPIIPNAAVAEQAVQQAEQVVPSSPSSVVRQARLVSYDIHQLMRDSSFDEIKAALETGKVAINAKNKEGNTALHYLVSDLSYINSLESETGVGFINDYPHWYDYWPDEPPFQLTRLLLQHGANPSLENDAGFSAYDIAMEISDGGEDEWIDGTLALFAQTVHGINGTDGNLLTPLDYALRLANYNGDMWLARHLIAEGADVRDLNQLEEYDYETVLEPAAILMTDKEAFSSLLEGGGEIENSVKHREKLLQLAVTYNNRPVVEVLLDNDIDPSAGMFAAANRNGGFSTRVLVVQDPQSTMLDILLDRGANINIKHSERGFTPLQVATEDRNVEGVKILLERGADPNIINIFGRSALHYTTQGIYSGLGVRINKLIMASMLLAEGAVANIRDKDGKTPYDYAPKEYKYANEHEQMAIAATTAILLEGMVGAEGRDAQGRNMSHWVELSGDSKTVKALIDGRVKELLEKMSVESLYLEIYREIDPEGYKLWFE